MLLHLKHFTASNAIIQRVLDRSSTSRLRLRRNRSESQGRRYTSTRKVTIGWKHSRAHSAYQLVPLRKGGGSHSVDIPKDHNMSDLKNKAESMFFPNGRSMGMNLNLCDLDTHMANFQGEPLSEVTQNGQPFTIDSYARERSSPVRLYLHTSLKEGVTPADVTESMENNVEPVSKHP